MVRSSQPVRMRPIPKRVSVPMDASRTARWLLLNVAMILQDAAVILTVIESD